jgi:hypothetical protein
MCGAQQPRPERHGGRPPDLELALVDRWAQLAMKQPWRYTANWGVGVAATNLGLRMLLNDLSLIHNARHAICTAIGLSVFAWLYTAQLTRPLRRRRRPHSATDTAVTKQSYAAHRRSKPPIAGPRSAPLWSCSGCGEPSIGPGERPRIQSRTRLRRWRLIFAVVTFAAVMLALLLGATVRQVPALRGGSDVVVPSQRS